MTAMLEERIAVVDGCFRRFFESRPAPAVAYGLVVDGELVHAGGLGSLDGDGESTPQAASIFRIASLTKMFTAATVLLLRDEGQLRLDAPAAEYVPELVSWKGPTRDSPLITIRHLLTMGAGLPTDDPWADRLQNAPAEKLSALLAQGVALAAPPDLGYEYSNLGYAMLGRIIANVTGRDYGDIVSDRFLSPLHLESTGFQATALPRPPVAGHVLRDGGWEREPLAPYGAFGPMGGLFSCVRDLARWIGWLADAFPPRDDPEGDEPLCRATRREMQQMRRYSSVEGHLSFLGDPAPIVVSGYGYGLSIQHDPWRGVFVGHNGGYPGFGANVRWHPGSGLGIVALANARYAPVRLATCASLNALVDADRSRRRSASCSSGATRARTEVERLLEVWEDARAAALFAPNVEMDEQLDRRRRFMEQIRNRLGRLAADDDAPPTSETPTRLEWWLRGQGGHVHVEALLDPETPPRVQRLTLEAVIDPSAQLRDLAERLVVFLADEPPSWPGDLALADALDPALIARALAVARSWYGPARTGHPIAGDGTSTATFLVEAAAATLELRVDVDTATGQLVGADLRPRECLSTGRATECFRKEETWPAS